MVNHATARPVVEHLALDVTQDAPKAGGLRTPGPVLGVHLVADSGGDRKQELTKLLYERLRLAAVVLFGVFAAFAPWGLWNADFGTWLTASTVAAQLVTTLVLGVVAVALCLRSDWSLRAIASR